MQGAAEPNRERAGVMGTIPPPGRAGVIGTLLRASSTKADVGGLAPIDRAGVIGTANPSSLDDADKAPADIETGIAGVLGA